MTGFFQARDSGSCDIREVCVHGCFLFTSVNTQCWAGQIIYPDFVSDFASIFLFSFRRVNLKIVGLQSSDFV